MSCSPCRGAEEAVLRAPATSLCAGTAWVGEHGSTPVTSLATLFTSMGTPCGSCSRVAHVEALEEALAQIKGTNSPTETGEGRSRRLYPHLLRRGYIKAIEEHRDKLLKQLEDIRVQKENSLQLPKGTAGAAAGRHADRSGVHRAPADQRLRPGDPHHQGGGGGNGSPS